MQLDAFTILIFGILVKALLGVLFLVFWLRLGRAIWFAWWSATFLMGVLAAILFLAGFAQGESTLAVVAGALMAAFACCWQGARAFERRRPLWMAALAAPAIWAGLCLVPGFLGNVTARVLVSSLLIAPLLGMTAFEFWRGRAERLPSRWMVIALFATFALVFAVRVPLVGVAPFPFGALPEQPNAVALFNVLMFFHTVLLAVLLVALNMERFELEQRTQAQTDSLTGALNRRAFMTRGHRLVLRHQKSGQPLCLLFLDLDRFKSLNDRFGHSGGDDALMRFVAVVHECIRPTDFLFRLGGEEFCCLLPATGVEDALVVAERIRRRMEAATLSVAGTPVKVTVSLGIASTETFGYDVDTLLRRADMAVYAAKRAGRNRVVVATADDVEGGFLHAVGRGMAAAS
ncbi:MAG: GGDEF domain-containing protein [Pseudorhodoplanes sp.]|nr:GGDEF domain-containing protein [Pseudorhodoplanes sp.]